MAWSPAPSRPEDLTRHELRVFSQNGEDGVIEAILRRVGHGPPSFVEFGVGAGTEGNCVFLADVLGWPGLFMESDPAAFAALAGKYGARPEVRTVQASVRPGNVEALIRSAGLPGELTVLSIDVDGMDYWIWRALEIRPRLLVIEYNAHLPHDAVLVQPLEPEVAWDGTDYFGASLGALRRLAASKGFRLVHTDLAGVNAFFVPRGPGRTLPARGPGPRPRAELLPLGGGPSAPPGRPALRRSRRSRPVRRRRWRRDARLASESPSGDRLETPEMRLAALEVRDGTHLGRGRGEAEPGVGRPRRRLGGSGDPRRVPLARPPRGHAGLRRRPLGSVRSRSPAARARAPAALSGPPAAPGWRARADRSRRRGAGLGAAGRARDARARAGRAGPAMPAARAVARGRPRTGRASRRDARVARRRPGRGGRPRRRWPPTSGPTSPAS